MKPHRFHPEANEEYAQAAAYYAKVSPGLGGRFYDEIERAIAAVCAAPGRFRRIDAEARRHLAEDFPYAVIYLDEPEAVWIIAIMHLKRAPDYWQRRLDR